MQNKSRHLNDLTNLATNAVGALKGLREEMKAIGRSQAEKTLADLDVVGRDEFEVLKMQMLQSLEEFAKLTKEVNLLKVALEKALSK